MHCLHFHAYKTVCSLLVGCVLYCSGNSWQPTSMLKKSLLKSCNWKLFSCNIISVHRAHEHHIILCLWCGFIQFNLGDTKLQRFFGVGWLIEVMVRWKLNIHHAKQSKALVSLNKTFEYCIISNETGPFINRMLLLNVCGEREFKCRKCLDHKMES